MSKSDQTALFIMPRSSYAWRGAEALWITAAGWASAAEKMVGHAEVITTDGAYSPDEVWAFPKGGQTSSSGTGLSKFLPQMLVTAIKDYQLYRKSKKFINQPIKSTNRPVSFVWEQHDLFTGYGRRVADHYNVPLITYVHAPTVWEARKWGVKRRMTGAFLERKEAENLKKSDLIACVSEQVKGKLIDMGIPGEKVLVSPMSVAPERFEVTDNRREQLRKELAIQEKFVFGWTGSFRNFHGLPNLVKVFSKVVKDNPDVLLMLVGDGKQRSEIEQLCDSLEISDHVMLTGRKSFLEIPDYVACFDAAIVSAAASKDFHYSPLKLREYLAAGKATLAPNAGEIPDLFKHGQIIHIYDIMSNSSLIEGLQMIKSDDVYRKKLEISGAAYIKSHGTWHNELNATLNLLTHLNNGRINSQG